MNYYGLIQLPQLNKPELSGFILEVVNPYTGVPSHVPSGSSGQILFKSGQYSAGSALWFVSGKFGFGTTSPLYDFHLASKDIKARDGYFDNLYISTSRVATSEEIAVSGQFIFNAVNQLSGYITTGFLSSGQINSLFYPRTNPSGFITTGQTGSFISIGQTGNFANTGWVNDNYYPRTNPSGYVQSSATGSFVTTGQTGDYYPRSNPSGYVLSSSTGNFVTTSQTGQFQPTGSYVLTSQTGLFVTTGQTGDYYPRSNPSGYVLSSATGNFVTTSQTGQFQPVGSYVTTSQTGTFVTSGQTGNFVTQGQITNFVSQSSTGALSGSFVSHTQTGSLATTGWVNQYYYPNSNPSGFLTIGESSSYVSGVNKTNSSITRGMVVYISGAQGNTPKILPAIASSGSQTPSHHIIGVANENVAVNQTGLIKTAGVFRGVDTSSFNDGDLLYLSSSISGGLTNVPNSSPVIENIFIGYSLNSTPNGAILLSIRVPYNLEELHAVAISNPIEGDFLRYNATSGLWQNYPLNTGQFQITGNYVTTAQTGNFVTTGQTGDYYPRSNPSGYVQSSATGNFGSHWSKQNSTVYYTGGQVAVGGTGLSGAGISLFVTGQNKTGLYVAANVGDVLSRPIALLASQDGRKALTLGSGFLKFGHHHVYDGNDHLDMVFSPRMSWERTDGAVRLLDFRGPIQAPSARFYNQIEIYQDTSEAAISFGNVTPGYSARINFGGSNYISQQSGYYPLIIGSNSDGINLSSFNSAIRLNGGYNEGVVVNSNGTYITHASASSTPLYISAAASQTADITKWRNSSNQTVLKVNSSFNLVPETNSTLSLGEGSNRFATVYTDRLVLSSDTNYSIAGTEWRTFAGYVEFTNAAAGYVATCRISQQNGTYGSGIQTNHYSAISASTPTYYGGWNGLGGTNGGDSYVHGGNAGNWFSNTPGDLYLLPGSHAPSSPVTGEIIFKTYEGTGSVAIERLRLNKSGSLMFGRNQNVGIGYRESGWLEVNNGQSGQLSSIATLSVSGTTGTFSEISSSNGTFSNRVISSGTGVVLQSETGNFYPSSNPSGYVQSSQTGSLGCYWSKQNSNSTVYYTGGQVAIGGTGLSGAGVSLFVSGQSQTGLYVAANVGDALSRPIAILANQNGKKALTLGSGFLKFGHHPIYDGNDVLDYLYSPRFVWTGYDANNAGKYLEIHGPIQYASATFYNHIIITEGSTHASVTLSPSAGNYGSIGFPGSCYVRQMNGAAPMEIMGQIAGINYSTFNGGHSFYVNGSLAANITSAGIGVTALNANAAALYITAATSQIAPVTYWRDSSNNYMLEVDSSFNLRPSTNNTLAVGTPDRRFVGIHSTSVYGYSLVSGASLTGNLVSGTTGVFNHVTGFSGSFSSISGANAIFSNFSIYPSGVPSGTGSYGLSGQITWDNNYLYVCVANNSWRRTSLGTW